MPDELLFPKNCETVFSDRNEVGNVGGGAHDPVELVGHFGSLGVMRGPVRIEAAGEGLAGKGGVRIRLVCFGRNKLPYYRIIIANYRIIIANSRCRRDGSFLEMVGHYNPMPDKNGAKDIQVNGERIKYWMSVGAQPSDMDIVKNILYRQGIMTLLNFLELAPPVESLSILIIGGESYLGL